MTNGEKFRIQSLRWYFPFWLYMERMTGYDSYYPYEFDSIQLAKEFVQNCIKYDNRVAKKWYRVA